MYLGTLARNVGLKCAAQQGVSIAARHTFSTTLEGSVRAQSRPVGMRVWNLSTSQATTASDHATLADFASGAWGPGPFYFVPADGVMGNALTPGASSGVVGEWVTASGALVADAGPVTIGDYTAPRSAAPAGGEVAYYGKSIIPAPPFTITASLNVLGVGARCRIAWYNSAGKFLSSSSSAITSDGTWVRSWVSAKAPAGAAGFRVASSETTDRAVLPAVSFTDGLMPWADGRGAAKAVLHDASSEMVYADSRSGVYSSLGYSITEVG